jgi:hypothetical protein
MRFFLSYYRSPKVCAEEPEKLWLLPAPLVLSKAKARRSSSLISFTSSSSSSSSSCYLFGFASSIDPDYTLWSGLQKGNFWQCSVEKQKEKKKIIGISCIQSTSLDKYRGNYQKNIAY